jgi:hypothetical protein
MNKRKASLDNLHKLLTDAANKLDRAAREIRDIPFEPRKEYIRKIAGAIGNILDIRHKIYQSRPDLQPDYLRKLKPLKNREANRAWGNAMMGAVDLEGDGDIDGALSTLEAFLATDPPDQYRREVKAHIARLNKTYRKKSVT